METSKKDNFKHALCYVPIASIVLFFTETNRSSELNKHIKYGFFLMVAYMIVMFFFSWVFGGLLTLVYIGIAGYLGYRAYNGEEVELEVFDEFEKTVREKMNEQAAQTTKESSTKASEKSSEKNKKEEIKKEEKVSKEEQTNDVLEEIGKDSEEK